MRNKNKEKNYEIENCNEKHFSRKIGSWNGKNQDKELPKMLEK